MDLQQFLLILRARAKVVVCTLGMTVLATLIVSLIIPNQYTATTTVVVDIKSPDPVVGSYVPALTQPGYMATQVDIVTSDRVAQRAVKVLRMDENPTVQAQWREATKGRGQITEWLGNILQRKLEVKPSRDSNVININFGAEDPVFAAAAANAFAQAYIDVNLELKVEPARQYSVWFDQQTKILRDKLEKAQGALSEYQQKTGIVVTDQLRDYETAKINDISTQLTFAQGQSADSQSKRTALSEADKLQEVIQNPLIQNLKGQVAELESKLEQSNVILGKNHPQTLSMQSQLASLKAKLESETHRISSSIEASYRTSKQKEKELQAGINSQKSKVLELNKQRDEISVLQRDVEQAQKDFEAVSMRSAQSKLESQSIQTNISILNPASEPLSPSRPRVLLNVVLSIFIGSMLGVGLAFLLELGNRRIRSAEDLAATLEIPVLAEISSTIPPLPNIVLFRQEVKRLVHLLLQLPATIGKKLGRHKSAKALSGGVIQPQEGTS